MLRLAEKELTGEAERVYDAVAGRAVDPEYEKLRRASTVAHVAVPHKAAARKLIWC